MSAKEALGDTRALSESRVPAHKRAIVEPATTDLVRPASCSRYWR